MKVEHNPRQSVEDSQASSSSQGYLYSHREKVLAEKEIKLTQLESLVKQAEMKAEQARKARELAEWEKDLQRREIEARRRLADAERMLRDNSLSDSLVGRRQDQYDDPNVILTPEELASRSPSSRPRNSVILPRSMAMSPTDSGGSADSSFLQSRHLLTTLGYSNHQTQFPSNSHSQPFSTPQYRSYTYTSTPLLRLSNPNTIPIVLPSTAKLPPSAIKLTPHFLHHLPQPQSQTAPHTPPVTQDTPINLSKSKTRHELSPTTPKPSPTFRPVCPPSPTSRPICPPSPTFRPICTPPPRPTCSQSPTLEPTSPLSSISRPVCTPGSPVLRRALLTPQTPRRTVRTLIPTIVTQPTAIPPPTATSLAHTNTTLPHTNTTLPHTNTMTSNCHTYQPANINIHEADNILHTPVPAPEYQEIWPGTKPSITTDSSMSNTQSTTSIMPTTPSPTTPVSQSKLSQTNSKPEVPCVEITNEAVMEMQVGVVDDGSMDGGANISFPFNDSTLGTSFLFGDHFVLDSLLDSSDGKVVNMVATEGEDGRMTLVINSGGGVDEDEDTVQDTGVEVMENELKNIKKSMNEIQIQGNSEVEKVETPSEAFHNEEVCTEKAGFSKSGVFSPLKLNRSRTASAVISDMVEDNLDNLQQRIEENTEESGGDLVEYFEMRLKEFESEVVQQGTEMETDKNAIDIANLNSNQLIHIANTAAIAAKSAIDSQILKTVNRQEKKMLAKLDNSEHLENDEDNIPENEEDNIPENDEDDISGKDRENSPETELELNNTSISITDAEATKTRKKRRRDCPGTSWFGCSSKQKVKKRKVEEEEKVTPSVPPDHAQVSSHNIKRRSGRLQTNPTDAESVPSTPPPSLLLPSPPPHPAASSTLSQQFSCGRCPSVLKSERGWQTHRAAVHGGGARLEGDPLGQTFSTDEEEQAWREAFSLSKRVNCPRCNKEAFTRKSKLVDHLKTCMVEEVTGKEASAEVAAGVEVDSIVKCESRVKRRAATNAQGRVAEFVRQMKTRFEGESEAEEDVDTSEDSDDNYDVKNEAGVSALFKVVRNNTKRISYKCNVCNEKFPSKENVKSHVVTEHQTEMLAGEDDDDDYNDETGGDEDESDPDYSHARPRYKRRSDATSSGPRRPILQPCPDMVKMEYNFRTKFYDKNFFSSLTVNMSDWVPEGQDSSFLPTSSISARFTVSNLSNNEDGEEGRILEMFSGGLINNSLMMFCGGPVSAMAWCPLDMADKGDQVMAIVAKLDFNPTIQSEESDGQGLIQMWRMGRLEMEGGGEAPTFQFGILHCYGSVRGVEWCPSGGTRGDRLCLLAAACGDGSVRVWAIPSLDTVQEEGRIYRREADMSLLCGQEEKVGQCLALSWYRGPGHNHIAASSSSGLVCIWDLSTTSSLLKKSTSLLPRQTWLAHTGSVTGLSLCPGEEEQPRYLVTGGSDRCYRFWDLRDTRVPMQEVKRGMVSGVRWLSGWSAASVSYDDVYLQGHTQTIITETGYYSTRSHPVIAQNSSVLDQDMSHWAGSLAIGTAAGELVVFVVPPLDRSMEHDKNLGQRKTYVFRTEVDKENKEEVDLRMYESMREACTMKYMDMPHKNDGQKVCSTDDIKRARVAERMDMEDLTCFPLASISRVAWNNNLGSQLWLASGGQSGLVRAHCVQALNTGAMREVFMEVMESKV